MCEFTDPKKDCKDTPIIKNVYIVPLGDEWTIYDINSNEFKEYSKRFEIELPNRVTDNG